MNKKVSLLAVPVAALILAGCGSNSSPTPASTTNPASSPITIEPSPSSEAATEPTSEAPQTDPTTTAAVPTETAPSSDSAAPPATQFAERWGKKYPNIPEYAILKAANGTCKLIATTGNGWQDNDLIREGIRQLANAAGIEDNDALEFATDANDNYCDSVSNPT